jgi:fructose 1,6-bisphosphatase
MNTTASEARTDGLTREAFLTQERERVPKRVTLTVVSANLLGWLGGVSSIPEDVLDAGRTVLHQARERGDVRDYRLFAFGSDLHMQMNTLGKGLHAPTVPQLACEVASGGLRRTA